VDDCCNIVAVDAAVADWHFAGAQIAGSKASDCRRAVAEGGQPLGDEFKLNLLQKTL
jgi:hypothetical protein